MKSNQKICSIAFKATILLAVLLAPAVLLWSENTFPERQEKYVNDYAGVLAATDRNTLSEMIKSYEAETGDELTVVTVKNIADYSPVNTDIDGFAAQLFAMWGIGLEKQNPGRGILLFVSTGDRKIKIETGTAFSVSENDRMLEIVQKKMVPFFRQGSYSRGIYDGVRELLRKNNGNDSRVSFDFRLAAGAVVIILVVLAAFLSAGKRVKKTSVMKTPVINTPAARTPAARLPEKNIKIPPVPAADNKVLKPKTGNDIFGGGAAGEW